MLEVSSSYRPVSATVRDIDKLPALQKGKKNGRKIAKCLLGFQLIDILTISRRDQTVVAGVQTEREREQELASPELREENHSKKTMKHMSHVTRCIYTRRREKAQRKRSAHAALCLVCSQRQKQAKEPHVWISPPSFNRSTYLSLFVYLAIYLSFAYLFISNLSVYLCSSCLSMSLCIDQHVDCLGRREGYERLSAHAFKRVWQ